VYVHSDGECENENTITQNEIDLCDEWDRDYKWDEKRNEFNSGEKRLLSWIAYPTASQKNNVKKIKEVEYLSAWIEISNQEYLNILNL
jgi:hypothetical protein